MTKTIYYSPKAFLSVFEVDWYTLTFDLSTYRYDIFNLIPPGGIIKIYGSIISSLTRKRSKDEIKSFYTGYDLFLAVSVSKFSLASFFASSVGASRFFYQTGMHPSFSLFFSSYAKMYFFLALKRESSETLSLIPHSLVFKKYRKAFFRQRKSLFLGFISHTPSLLKKKQRILGVSLGFVHFIRQDALPPVRFPLLLNAFFSRRI
jgi:hypothetical protein